METLNRKFVFDDIVNVNEHGCPAVYFNTKQLIWEPECQIVRGEELVLNKGMIENN